MDGWGLFFIALFVGLCALIVWAYYEKYKDWRQPFVDKQNTLILLQKYGCSHDKKFIYISGIPGFPEHDYLWIWKDKDILKVQSSSEKTANIPIKDIIFYSLKGDLRADTQFIKSKNSTGGTSIVEGLLGTAAAMRNAQTMSKTVSIDERRTIVKVILDGVDRFIVFERGDLYNFLLEIIPEKEESLLK